MDPTVVAALVAALASVIVAAVGSIAAAKLQREQRRSVERDERVRAAELEAESERKARDQLIAHYRGLISDLIAEITRLRAQIRAQEGGPNDGSR